MDAFEAAKVVHDRIKQLEPHVAKKIIGYMLLQEIPEEEMIRLALGPDSLILNLIQKAKTTVFVPSSPIVSSSISPTEHFTPFLFTSPRHFSAPASFWRLASYHDPQLAIPYSDLEYGLQNQLRGSEEPQDTTKFGFPTNMTIRGSRTSINTIDHPVKSCHYFNKGFCKHGSNCRYYHGESFSESYSHAFGPSLYESNSEDQVLYTGSLEKLELEVIELLKSRRGNPVSIASLPMMYYEKYGRTLQADGYLSESQRHGKAGYSLTKLLARLNSIRLIDRPHGQHAVILAEDAPKYMDIQGERNELGPILSGSRQIYLTFPAESSFLEEDVSNYFSTFGPVQDVRIPCQQKRMFGFVTFVSANTVKLILSKGNPHYVCGARVLVKPYREKSKLVERKYMEKFDSAMFYRSHPIDIDSKLQSRSGSCRLFKRQLMEEHDNALELETRHLSQLQLAPKHLANQFCSDQTRFPSPEHYNYLFNVPNSGSTSGNKPKYPVNNCSDRESAQGLNLPDSPFASGSASSISAIM